jgi:hypothetical protein
MNGSQAFARGFLGFFDSLSLTGRPLRRRQAPVCLATIQYFQTGRYAPKYTCTLPAGHRGAHCGSTETRNWL